MAAPIGQNAQPAAAGRPRKAAEALKTWARRFTPAGQFPELAQIAGNDLGIDSGGNQLDGHGHPGDNMGGLLTLVGLFASACASSGDHTSPSATRSGAPWAQDLNEPPPPSRESANAAQIKADLTAAREKASRPW